jgi:type VI secretion system secreted protein Hcp
MAVDMFLELDGIKGESKDGTHKDKIDVLAWSWGLSQSGSAHLGSGAGAGKVNVQDISFTKYVDLASCDLMASCATGKHIPKAKLIIRKAGDKPLEYLSFAFKDLIVSSVSTGGSGGEDRLTENITLNFAVVQAEYWVQDTKGGKGTNKSMGWDIPANKAP